MTDGVLGGPDVDLLALDVDLAAEELIGTEDGPHGLGTACADQTGKAGDLARMGLEADILQDAGLVEVPGLQPDLALLAEFLGVEVVQSTADHGLDQGVLGHILDIFGNDVLAVTHNGDAVAQFEKLFEFVGNEQHGDAPGFQTTDGGHQLRDLFLTEGGGGLVHDDQLCVQRDRLGDLDHLLQADAQLAALSLNVDLGMTQRGEGPAGFLVHLGVVQERALLDGPAHEHVVRDGQLLDDIQFLINAGDTCFPGLDGVAEGHLAAIHKDLALFGDIDTGEDLDQGGFTGAVLTDQSMDLAGTDAQGHALQSHDTGEPFYDIF